MRHLCLLVVLLLAACGSTRELEPEFRPLTQMRESDTVTLGVSDQGAVTIDRTVYVHDISQWLRDHPEPEYTAVMKHEQVHSIRQRDMGVAEWISRYIIDPDFMLEEEKLGWYEQIRWMQSHGALVVPEAIALILHDYHNVGGTMVSYADARQWVQDVLAGRWVPE